MEKEKYNNMKRTAEDRTRWNEILRKHQLDVTLHELHSRLLQEEEENALHFLRLS